MPFSFHGGDIFCLNYPAFKFVNDKLSDPYLMKNQNSFRYPSYPVGIFYILAFFQFLFKPFLLNLKGLYAYNFIPWASTIHIADFLSDFQLFKTLFLFKIPYLICDFLIGFILFKILKEDKDKVFIGLTVWAFNPFVLHSVYALGQYDIIVALFIMLSLFAVRGRNPYLSVIYLALGASVKVIPILLIPLSIIILGKNLKHQIKLACIALIALLMPFIPFYLTSKFAAFYFFNIDNVGSLLGISGLRRNIFILTYLFLLIMLYFFKKKEIDTQKVAILSFTLILLLFYSIYVVRLRYFIWITPLLILLSVQKRKFWIYNIIFFITLFEMLTSGNSQQWGMFAPLHPEFFSSLPILDSYLNLFLNATIIHRFMFKIFLITCLTMIIHLLLDHKELFKIFFAGVHKR